MKNRITAAVSLLLVVLINACTHDPQRIAKPTPVPVSVCDSTHISYTKDIKLIFSTHCYSCHSTAVTGNGGLDLEDTASLRFYLRLGFGGDNIYGSKLYHCMLHSQFDLGMPLTYTVDTCSLSKIHYWLQIGAPMN